jgi:hypothetical protein
VARTVAARRDEAAPDPSPRGLVSRYIYRGRGACGFCTVLTREGVRHDLCVEKTDTTAPGRKDNVVWTCKCAEKGHQP